MTSTAPTAPSAIFDDVTLLSGSAISAEGRGGPDALPDGVNTNVPACPWSSDQSPPSVARLMAVVTCTGTALGGVTIVKPIVTEPVGLGTAMPTTAARVPAPH